MTHRSSSFPSNRHRVRAHPSVISRSGFGRLLVTHIDQSKTTRAGKATKALVALTLCVGFAFVLPGTASTRTAASRSARVAIPMSLDHMASEVVYLVNLQRAQHSLPPLRVNTRLVKDAKLQAAQIAETGILDHVILAGPYPTPRVRAEVAGYAWNALGENLAFGYPDAASAVAAWMDSPGHRANILAGGYSETGVVLEPDAHGRLIFVETFGAPQ